MVRNSCHSTVRQLLEKNYFHHQLGKFKVSKRYWHRCAWLCLPEQWDLDLLYGMEFHLLQAVLDSSWQWPLGVWRNWSLSRWLLRQWSERWMQSTIITPPCHGVGSSVWLSLCGRSVGWSLHHSCNCMGWTNHHYGDPFLRAPAAAWPWELDWFDSLSLSRMWPEIRLIPTPSQSSNLGPYNPC